MSEIAGTRGGLDIVNNDHSVFTRTLYVWPQSISLLLRESDTFHLGLTQAPELPLVPRYSPGEFLYFVLECLGVKLSLEINGRKDVPTKNEQYKYKLKRIPFFSDYSHPLPHINNIYKIKLSLIFHSFYNNTLSAYLR